MRPTCNVAKLIERYFTERLMHQRNVSANTIASYRDTFRLLFTFAQARLRQTPVSPGARRARCAIHQRVPR
jgi:site-specific recombinase XerD